MSKLLQYLGWCNDQNVIEQYFVGSMCMCDAPIVEEGGNYAK